LSSFTLLSMIGYNIHPAKGVRMAP